MPTVIAKREDWSYQRGAGIVELHRPKSVNPWVVTMSVMLATFMEILDTTVVNVSIQHIAGSMAATVEEGTWVVTSYLVSNAIILPMSGWLANRFGRRVAPGESRAALWPWANCVRPCGPGRIACGLVAPGEVVSVEVV